MSTSDVASDGEGMGAGLIAAMPTILWQRRWLIIVPLLVAVIAGVVAAFTIHPVYQSSATVLIEAQQVPGDLINPGQTDGDPISERVARARERVLARQDLIRLIRAYNLYPGEQQTQPLSKIVDTMRKNTTIAAVDDSMGFTGRRNFGAGNTTAITVSYEYDDPVKAQVVAQQFVNHLLEVDASTQASQAADAVNFLTDQANTTGAQMAAIENRINAIKAQNGTVLALGQSTGNADSDVSRIDAEIAALQAETSKLTASGSLSVRDDSTGVAAAEAQLRVAQAKYSDTHPDVVAARAQLDAARRAAAASSGRSAYNPIAGEIAANRAQLASLINARGLILSRSSTVQAAQARAPALAGEIDQLEKQADTLREQGRSIGAKLQAAQIQSRVETEQKGERLTLADPPVVPDSPIRPNRPALIIGSIVGGLAAGLGLVLLLELLMQPIRGTAALKSALGEAPLAVVPDFDQKPSWVVRFLERRTRRKIARA